MSAQQSPVPSQNESHQQVAPAASFDCLPQLFLQPTAAGAQSAVQVSPDAHTPLPQVGLTQPPVPKLHSLGAAQVPHTPPQPSLPHNLPEHCLVQVPVPVHAVPSVLQVWPAAQVPQVPEQPSLPQTFPVHFLVQVAEQPLPSVLQVWPVAQVPQVPLQPSLPHTLPVQFLVQVAEQALPSVLQVWPLGQAPQLPPQPSLPHTLPLQFLVHVAEQPVPSALQVWPLGQAPQVPVQPSLPQILPVQFLVQLEQSFRQLTAVSPVSQMALPQVLGTHRVPVELQLEPVAHLAHNPPQPSEPQALPSHFLTHGQSPGQVVVDSPASHTWLPHKLALRQALPSALHVWPSGQLPHSPPQLSSPHFLPTHLGVQAAFGQNCSLSLQQSGGV